MATKTYILRNGNQLGLGFTVGNATRRVTFSGSTAYNQGFRGTFQTADVELQRAMENSKMYNDVYDLWIASGKDNTAKSLSKKDDVKPVFLGIFDTVADLSADKKPAGRGCSAFVKETQSVWEWSEEAGGMVDTKEEEDTDKGAANTSDTPNTDTGKTLTPVKVESWQEAKKYMVENYDLPKNTPNNPAILKEKATSFGIDFGLDDMLVI